MIGYYRERFYFAESDQLAVNFSQGISCFFDLYSLIRSADIVAFVENPLSDYPKTALFVKLGLEIHHAALG